MRSIWSLAILAFLVSMAPARSETLAEFYQGKSLSVYIGYTAGGGYDVYARLLARHMGKHIPGAPTVIPRNMEGAGSLRLANWLYSVAPTDGTAIGTVGRGAPFDQLLGRPGIQFDAPKFSWIGSMNDEVAVCVSWRNSGVKTFEDLKTKPLIVGAAGPGNDDDLFPRVMNAILGTKMNIITAYPGGNDVTLAMERGEVSGRCGWSWSSIRSSQASWVADGRLNVLVQLGLGKHADLPDVPLILDLAATDEQRQSLKLIFARQALGRPFLAPPGVPEDRKQALRAAFMATMKDADFVADADRGRIEITPLSGDALETLVGGIFRDTTPQLAKSVAAVISAP